MSSIGCVKILPSRRRLKDAAFRKRRQKQPKMFLLLSAKRRSSEHDTWTWWSQHLRRLRSNLLRHARTVRNREEERLPHPAEDKHFQTDEVAKATRDLRVPEPICRRTRESQEDSFRRRLQPLQAHPDAA